MSAKPPFAPLKFAEAALKTERQPDGSLLLSSAQPLAPYARCVGEWLVAWADKTPQRVFLAERAAGGWRHITYAETLATARRIGTALLRKGLSAERPLVILSDNAIDHALLMLGALHVGIPVAPVSPAYSLMSKDHAKLKAIIQLLQPGLVYAADGIRFAAALDALKGLAEFSDSEIVIGANPVPGVACTLFADLPEEVNDAAVDRA